MIVSGIGVNPGRATGVLLRMQPPVNEPADATLPPGEDREHSASRVAAAANNVQAELDAQVARATDRVAAHLEAVAHRAADPALIAVAQQRVRRGTEPARAVWEATGELIAAMRSTGSRGLARIEQLQNVRDRIVAELMGRRPPGVPAPAHPFILTAHDLTPTDTATLDAERCLGIIIELGGPTSHTAILSRQLGIPAIVAAPGMAGVPEGVAVVIDGATGTLVVDPNQDEIDQVRQAAGHRTNRRFDGTGRTADGYPVTLLANVNDPKTARDAAASGAEGIGLFRTEFCFLDRRNRPTVEVQAAAYEQVFSCFPGRRVIVRTLDAGADKQVRFIPTQHEENPALGMRGLRLTNSVPGLLDEQLEAVAKAAARTQATVWVMAPMVSTMEEARAFVERATHFGLPRAGAMIEVPSAALTAGTLMGGIHFASVGTNDLTQYVMAADRLQGELASLNDVFQPAVLNLLKTVADAGVVYDRPVGVCGEAAADPVTALVFVGLGITSLSMSYRSIPDVAALLASVTRDECRRAADLALRATSATEGRRAVRSALGVLADLGL